MTSKNDVKIFDLLYHHSVASWGDETYGYKEAKIVYAMYEDGTWELLTVYDFDYITGKINKNLQLGNKFKNKTRGEAIAIIKKLIESGKMAGKLLI